MRLWRHRINGPAAHLVRENDTVILITYAQMTTEEARTYVPKIVHVDHDNKIVRLGSDPTESINSWAYAPAFRSQYTGEN